MANPGDQVVVIIFQRKGEREPTAEVFGSKLSADKRFRELLAEKTKDAAVLYGPFTVEVQR